MSTLTTIIEVLGRGQPLHRWRNQIKSSWRLWHFVITLYCKVLGSICQPTLWFPMPRIMSEQRYRRPMMSLRLSGWLADGTTLPPPDDPVDMTRWMGWSLTTRPSCETTGPLDGSTLCGPYKKLIFNNYGSLLSTERRVVREGCFVPRFLPPPSSSYLLIIASSLT